MEHESLARQAELTSNVPMDEAFQKILDALIPTGERRLLDDAEMAIPGIDLTRARLSLNITVGAIGCAFEGQAVSGVDEILQSLGQSDDSAANAGKLVAEDEFGSARAIDEAGTWVVERGLPGDFSRRGDGLRKGNLYVSRILHSTGKESPGFIESYLLDGVALPFWPRPVTVKTRDHENISMRELWIHVGSARFILRRNLDPPFVTRFLVVAAGGIRWSHRAEVKNVLPALSFLLGSNIRVIADELWSIDGALLERRWFNCGPSEAGRRRAPIPLTPDVSIERLLSTLLDSYSRVCDSLFLEQALFHLEAAVSLPTEARFALLSVVFETLSSSFARRMAGGQSETAKYVDQARFRNAMKPLISAAQKGLLDVIDKKTWAAIEGKLWSANNKAMADRAETMLLELGIVVDSNIEKILKLRNSAIHEGVLSRQRPPDWQQVLDFESGMQTLLHKILLRLLGYEGPFIDFGSRGHPTKILQPGQPDSDAG